VDAAGNIGPVPLASGTANGGTPAGGGPFSLPNTAAGSGGLAAPAALLLALVAIRGTLTWRRRKRSA
jgi:LPXTG-motif cell wall-anchored protein